MQWIDNEHMCGRWVSLCSIVVDACRSSLNTFEGRRQCQRLTANLGADAIGGVPVCVDANLHSRTSDGKGSGLKLKKGTTEIKGEDALAWLRTRYGFGDGSDIARAKAQHMYMNSLVRKLRENTGLSSPNKLRNLAEEATEALTVDEELASVAELYALAEELKKVAPNRTTMATMPWIWSPSDHNRVEPKPDDAEQLFRLVREDIAAGRSSLSRAVEVVSRWSAYWETAPSGRPVTAIVVAPRSKAVRSGSITSPVVPEWVMAIATSRGRSCTALVTARCGSAWAWAIRPIRSSFCARSCATSPEAPMP